MLSVAVSNSVPVLNVPPESNASVTMRKTQVPALGNVNVAFVVTVAGAAAPSAVVFHGPATKLLPSKYSTLHRTVRKKKFPDVPVPREDVSVIFGVIDAVLDGVVYCELVHPADRGPLDWLITVCPVLAARLRVAFGVNCHTIEPNEV
jgi:hypothetical protein